MILSHTSSISIPAIYYSGCNGLSQVSFKVVEVDKYGYRVAPSSGAPWDKELADAVVMVAKAGYLLSKALGKPIGTIKIDWHDSLAVIKLQDGRVQSIIVEENTGNSIESIGSERGHAVTGV